MADTIQGKHNHYHYYCITSTHTQTANLVASEFFEQGDRERNDLSLEPMV